MDSTRGAGGGFTGWDDRREISVGDVLRVLEGVWKPHSVPEWKMRAPVRITISA